MPGSFQVSANILVALIPPQIPSEAVSVISVTEFQRFQPDMDHDRPERIKITNKKITNSQSLFTLSAKAVKRSVISYIFSCLNIRIVNLKYFSKLANIALNIFQSDIINQVPKI